MPKLVWRHVADDAQCTGVTMQRDASFICLEHRMAVEYEPAPVGEVGQPTVEGYTTKLAEHLTERLEALGVPVHLMPAEEETSSYALRLLAFKTDVAVAAHQAAGRHGFDKSEVDISVRVPLEAREVSITLVKSEAPTDLVVDRGPDGRPDLSTLREAPTVGDCEGCGAAWTSCRAAAAAHPANLPCCPECEHRS